MDGMENLPHVLHPEIHYELLSKRGLAMTSDSFLTPKSRILDLKLDLAQRDDMLWPGVDEAIEAWEKEVYETVTTRSLPFVFKLQHSILGKGTYIIKTEESRNDLLGELQEILSENGLRTTEFNHHSMPATLVVTMRT